LETSLTDVILLWPCIKNNYINKVQFGYPIIYIKSHDYMSKSWILYREKYIIYIYMWMSPTITSYQLIVQKKKKKKKKKAKLN